MGRHWTTKEINLIKNWQGQGIFGKEQAKRLNRSYFSWKSAVIRYKLSTEDNPKYNHLLRLNILNYLAQGLPQKEIVKRMNYNCHATVSKIVQELYKKGLLIKINRLKYIPSKEWTG